MISCNVAEAQWFFPFQRPAYSYAPSESWPRDFPDDTLQDEKTPSEPVGPTNSYCVRTCDGRYFPLAKQNNRVTEEQMCKALCPAASTKVFSGNAIEKSLAADGTRYMSLPNALVYQTRIVSDCSCNGTDTFGLKTTDLNTDPTLRTGDIVVQSTGFTTFQGGSVPYKATAFKKLDRSRLPAGFNAQLLGAKIAPVLPNATPKASTAPQTPHAIAEKALFPKQTFVRSKQALTPAEPD